MAVYYDGYDWDTDGFPGEYVYGDDTYVDGYYMGERWKPIDPIGKYWVSDHARVWSEATHRFLKLKPLDRKGHLGVCLCYGSYVKYEYISRLVAKAFKPNPHNLPVVRHLNDDPTDNELDNLAWGTQRDNALDAILNGKAHFVTPEEREIGLAKKRIPVIATCLQTGVETWFRSQTDAARDLNIQQSNIWKVLNGERSHAGGYSFRYVREDGDIND